MKEQFSRTAMLLGIDGIEKLSTSKVLVFGVGGVGGFVVEGLARAGVGTIDIVDNDQVCPSNLNRQIIALHSTIGEDKVDIAKRRIQDINPDCKVTCYKCFYLPANGEIFDFNNYDYVIDAIDTVTAKIDIIVRCTEAGVPIISSMGTGNKLDPTKIEIADIYKTKVDPLAKVMRRELKKRGVKKLKVVYSAEEAMTPMEVTFDEEPKNETEVCTACFSKKDNSETDISEKKPARAKQTPGSVSFVPSVAGLVIAGEVIKDILKN